MNDLRRFSRPLRALPLLLLLSLAPLNSCGSPAPLNANPNAAEVMQSASNSRLVAPLGQALNAALQQAHQARSPEEAQQLAHQRFFSELNNLLRRQLTDKDVQLQVQAQWSATGKIQMQLQAQISDQNITAQAQRQDLFAPNY